MSNFSIPDLEKLAKSGLSVPAVNQVYPPLLPPLGTQLNTHLDPATPLQLRAKQASFGISRPTWYSHRSVR